MEQLKRRKRKKNLKYYIRRLVRIFKNSVQSVKESIFSLDKEHRKRLFIVFASSLALLSVLIIVISMVNCHADIPETGVEALMDKTFSPTKTPNTESTENDSTPDPIKDGGNVDGAESEIIPSPEPTPSVWFERGSKDDEIINIQTRLMKLGYLDNDEPTDYFGPATEAAVLLFQRQHELTEDGIIGNMTYELMFSKEAKKYVMYEGASGKDIKAFQYMLADLGYLNSNQVTGYFGTDTVSAVKSFQKRNKLTVDGKAGEKTIDTINSDTAKPSAEYEAAIAAEKKKAEEEAKKNSASTRINNFISIAKKQLGCPYILGDSGPDTFDCSGLVYYCLRKAGVYTRRMNAAGYSKVSSWKKITKMSDLKKGDLIFFKSDHSNSVSHVGIYIGSGTMIDASTSNGKVVQRSCTGSWSKRNFVCGRRPIS